jgi:hypothetical protein
MTEKHFDYFRISPFGREHSKEERDIFVQTFFCEYALSITKYIVGVVSEFE